MLRIEMNVLYKRIVCQVGHLLKINLHVYFLTYTAGLGVCKVDRT